MAFLAGLLFFYFTSWGVSTLAYGVAITPKMRGILAAAICFILVGLTHFLFAQKFEQAIPNSWPYKTAENYLSGIAEIALGAGLLLPGLRRLCAAGLILLLIVVFPVNIYMAEADPVFSNIFRLFFQPVYIWWVWWYCFRKK